MIFESSSDAIVRVDWIQYIGPVRPESLGHLGKTGRYFFPIRFQMGEAVPLLFETEAAARQDRKDLISLLRIVD